MKEFLHHLFVPRESNNHRARMLHAQPLLLLVTILMMVNFFTPHVERSYPTILGVEANISVEELLTLTNQKRVEAGLAPVTMDMQLSQAANMKAHDMFAKDYWSHNAPDGTTPWVFIKTSGYTYMYAGENLARGFTTANDAVTAWMASPGHRDNILSPNYKEIGFAIVPGTLTGDETILIVQMFGSKMTTNQAVGSAQNANPTDTPQPTVFIAQTIPGVSPLPTSVVPTSIPTVVPPLVSNSSESFGEEAPLFVASIQNDPIINRTALLRTIAITIAGLFICLFIVDMILIERKKIVRIVSHNIDHIMFIMVILLTLLLYGRGAIL